MKTDEKGKPLRKIRTNEKTRSGDMVTASNNIYNPKDTKIGGLIKVDDLSPRYHMNRVVNNDDIDWGFYYYRYI